MPILPMVRKFLEGLDDSEHQKICGQIISVLQIVSDLILIDILKLERIAKDHIKKKQLDKSFILIKQKEGLERAYEIVKELKMQFK